MAWVITIGKSRTNGAKPLKWCVPVEVGLDQRYRRMQNLENDPDGPVLTPNNSEGERKPYM